jgi:hypothetical protein
VIRITVWHRSPAERDPWKQESARKGTTAPVAVLSALGTWVVHQDPGEDDGGAAGRDDQEQADSQTGEVGDEPDQGWGQQEPCEPS